MLARTLRLRSSLAAACSIVRCTATRTSNTKCLRTQPTVTISMQSISSLLGVTARGLFSVGPKSVLLHPPPLTLSAKAFTTSRVRGLATDAKPAAANNREGDPSKFAFVLKDVTKRLPSGQPIFESVDLAFYHGAKVGVLGVNGSGKTSLLRIIAGTDRDYDGEAKAHTGFKTGYLEQEPKLDATKTVFENVLDGVAGKKALLDRFDAISQEMAEPNADFDKLCTEQSEIQTKIDGLGCWDLTRNIEQAMSALRCPPGDSPVTNLSGGERRRVALCRLLLSEPDILLLDEPTNHLDAGSVAWLEQFLHQYKGLVVAVTHDRYFLDKVAGYILEVDGGRCYGYRGNYGAWLQQKKQRLEMQARVDVARQKQISRELEWVKQPAQARHAKQKARLKKFEELRAQKSALTTSVSGAMVIPQGPRLGSNILELRNVTMKMEDNILFENLSLRMEPGAMLGIVGPNGSGKTTLLKLITSQIEPTAGTVTVGDSVRFGYNAQSRESLDETKSVWQEITGGHETIRINDHLQIAARAYCSQFNFKNTAQTKIVGQLSGGERNRVSLAKSMRSGCNVIILDEPTNDLDVDTLRALEECLTDFDGCGIIVSHDRWFLDRLCTHILAFHEDGTHTFFLGTYSEYEKERLALLGGKDIPKPRFRKIG